MTTRQRNTPYQAALPTGPTHVAARSNRTPAEVESNRVFMAAAGRVEFGRHENTLRTVWIAFALFASLGPERICYAAVERTRKDDDEEKPGIAERALVSGRTVRRHIPALIARGLIEAENRVGGRTPTVWKVILPDELIGPGRTACPPRPDTVSDDIKDQRYVPGRAAKPQARPGGKVVDCGSGPVTTAAPLKGSPVPSPSPLTVVATPEQHTAGLQDILDTIQRLKDTTSRTVTTPDDDDDDATTTPPTHSDDQEALFAEQDRQLQQQRQAAFTPTADRLTENTCPHDRIIGGSCHDCGYDDGTGPVPSADFNNGH